MQIILSAINSRHTHHAIALAYLAAYWQKVPGRPIPQIMEFDINQTTETIYSKLILAKPDVLAFSVYIWSLEKILSVCSAIKAACPETVIILGGPEVSYMDIQIMQENDFIDFIIRGEGEATFSELLEAILNNQPTESIEGISCRHAGTIRRNPDRKLIKNLDDIPSPFTSGYFGNGHGFIYYEASRGCPSKCSYCLSSIQGPVRIFSLERVKKDLDWFFNSNYRQVRFADRTFNFDFKRAAEIIKYIIANNHKGINFHFEFQADFMNEELFSLLQQAPKGMFHLEIGVQSTNKKALTSVNRRFNLEKLQENVTRLLTQTGCRLHLDLLGGLPEDSFNDFLTSLNNVYHLNPHSIQISLVKVLRGTPLEKKVALGDLKCMAKPPYTVLQTRWLKASEAVEIQDIGKLVEGIYNCNRFNLSLAYLIKHLFTGSAAAFFRKLRQWWRKQNLPFYNFSPDTIYFKLSEFVQNENALPDLKVKALIMLEHEFHLSQKVPCGKSQLGPQLVSGRNKNTLRVVPGLKSFWYAFDLLQIIGGRDPTSSGAFPAIYIYQKDLSAIPDTQLLQLSLPERFVIASIQRKVAPENFPEEWKKCCVSENFLPDFASVIEKLKSDGLLYDSREKNSREVKELIELARSSYNCKECNYANIYISRPRP